MSPLTKDTTSTDPGSAGVLLTAPHDGMAAVDFDIVRNTNLRGTFLCAQKALTARRAAATPANPSRAVVLSSNFARQVIGIPVAGATRAAFIPPGSR